ncbi:hypothetical protein C5167_004490 [Papaver somniferum]|uniref:Uncharacterized protein n=1 Tax=Papaver somniferum TaxID=3469 RepID=A0A4Y7J8P4_PAPSO|nr:hypothetical protein C5167_004490 [Papaver somniferum]
MLRVLDLSSLFSYSRYNFCLLLINNEMLSVGPGLMVHATYYGIGNDNLGNKDGADAEDNDFGKESTSAVYKIGGSGYNEVESTAAEVYVNDVK